MISYSLFFLAVYWASRQKTPIVQKSLQWSRAILVGLFLWLLFGLRDQTVAGDTPMYVYFYQSFMIHLDGLSFFWKEKEPFFYFTNFLCQKISLSYTFYFFVSSLLLIAGFAKLLKEYSDDMFLSVIVFCVIGTVFFCMAGLRQAIAIGCSMFAFYYAKQRKLLWFLLWCFCAYNFHNSAVVIFPTYLLVNRKANWKMWIICGLFLYLGATRDSSVMDIASHFTTKDYQQDEIGLNYTMFFIQLIFMLFCFFYGKKAPQYAKDKDFNSLMVMSFIGLCLQALTPIKGEFFRASLYFSLYLGLALPRVLSWLSIEERSQIYCIIVWGCLGYIYLFGAPRTYISCF